MSPRIALAAALVLGGCALTALAQTKEIQNKANARLAAERARLAEEEVRADEESARRERYEEIEILARLIDRGLARDAGVAHFGEMLGAVTFSPDGRLIATSRGQSGNFRLWDAHTGKAIAGHAAADFAGAQGVYLKGQGIVYALTVPAAGEKVVGGPSAPSAKELTEWERIRKELRGEKVEPAKPREQAGTSIADAVLKVIADNGKNLTRLPDGESVTVAITLPAMQSCVTCHAAKAGGSPGMMPPGGGGAPQASTPVPPGTGGGAGRSVPPGPGGSAGPMAGGADAEPDTSRAEFRKHALLGDLAMKQHDYNQAVQAFMQAAAVYREEPRESDAQLELIEVGTKMARAYIALGKRDEAERVMKSIARLGDHLTSGAAPATTADGKPQVPLSAKLIVKVPKALLDQWGLGKMTFDEFRKAASVEHLTFDRPADKAKGDASKP